jgi:hypothetical protein
VSEDSQFLSKPAIQRMRDAGLQVEETAYGFSITRNLGDNVITGECGGEHDGSVSISFGGLLGEAARTAHWFFRYSMREMADFLIAADKQAQTANEGWWECIQKLDSAYDHQDLESRLRQKYPDLWRAIDAE